MALDLTAMKEARKTMNESGPLPYLSQKELTEEDYFRIAPNVPEMAGLPYLKVYRYWFNNSKTLISMETFGKKDPIKEEFDAAMADGDPDVVAMLTNPDFFKKDVQFWFPGWHLIYKMKGGEVESISVKDNMSKVLQAGTQLAASIDDCCQSRLAQTKDENGRLTADGIADRKKGLNIGLSRIKKGSKRNDVSYKASLADQWEVPAHYFKNIVNPYEMAKAQTKMAAYQRAVMREFLYGEEIPKEIEAKQAESEEKRKKEWEEKRRLQAESVEAEAKNGGKKKAAPIVEEEEEDEPAPVKKKATKPAPVVEEEEEDDAPPPPAKKKKVIVKEEDEEDEAPFVEEEEEEVDPPVRKKKAVPVDDEEIDLEDEDEEEEAPAPVKKTVAKAAPAKKPKTIDEELDFED